MRQFVPMTDEVLYQRENFPGPLVPYQCGVPCWHQLAEESAQPLEATRTADHSPVAAAA